jgi:hypothetical protein
LLNLFRSAVSSELFEKANFVTPCVSARSGDHASVSSNHNHQGTKRRRRQMLVDGASDQTPAGAPGSNAQLRLNRALRAREMLVEHAFSAGQLGTMKTGNVRFAAP